MISRIITMLIFTQLFLTAQDTAIQLDNYLTRFLDNNERPGFAAAVIRGEDTLLLRGYGVTQAGDTLPVTGQTSFQAGSVTKSMTAVTAILMEKEDVLSLEDRVVEYLPWFRTSRKESSDRITLEMLLSNSSGLPSSSGNAYRQYATIEKGLEDQARTLASVSLTSEPGRSYQYSNTGFTLAGLVMSRAAGRTYEDLMQEHLFVPLGMGNTTTTPDPKGYPDNYGNGWAPSDRLFPLEKSGLDGSGLEPAGSRMRTTAEDMALYMKYLLTQRDNPTFPLWDPIVSHPGINEEMGGQNREAAYGLGLEIENIDDREIVYHSGGVGSFSSIMMMNRATGTGVVILANTGEQNSFLYEPLVTAANNLLHIAEGEETSNYGIPTAENPHIPSRPYNPPDLSVYEGVYRIGGESSDTMAPRRLSIEVQEGKLQGVFYTDQPFSKCDLTFFSPSTAGAVNNGPTFSVEFDISLQGKVTSVNTFGARYNREFPPGDDYGNRQWRNWTFLLPDNWESRGNEESFTAVNRKNGEQRITMGHMTDRELEDYLKLVENDLSLGYPEELAGSQSFHQLYSPGHLFLYSRGRNWWFTISLIASPEEITGVTQKVIRPLIYSLESP